MTPPGGATPVGTVRAVQVFPVKSMAGAPTASVRLDRTGVLGDRRFAVRAVPSAGTAGRHDPAGPAGAEAREGAVVTATDAPRLRDVVARLDPDGELRLALPGGSEPLSPPAADGALADLVGRPVRVAPVPAGSQLEAPVHLVSVQALAAAARGDHEAAGCACSLEEPRANLVLDVPGSVRAPEHAWVGRRVAVGEAVLEVRRRPGHCLGVYAEVAVPGGVRPGDPVLLLDNGGDAGAGGAA
jgi:hypothetical protein